MLQVECVLDWSVYMRGQTVWGSLNCDIKPWLEAHAHTPTEQTKKKNSCCHVRVMDSMDYFYLKKSERKRKKSTSVGFMGSWKEQNQLSNGHRNMPNKCQRYAEWLKTTTTRLKDYKDMQNEYKANRPQRRQTTTKRQKKSNTPKWPGMTRKRSEKNHKDRTDKEDIYRRRCINIVK